MSIKKISKDQPEKFEFNEKSLEVANKIISNYPKVNNKVLLWLFCILLKDKIIIGYLYLQ